MTDEEPRRPAALITGAGSLIGIAAGIAARLADDGWDLALSYWKPPDAGAEPAAHDEPPTTLAADLRARGATVVLLPGDLMDPAEPGRLMAAAVAAFGPLRGIVLSHAESVDSAILDTTVESFDRHMIINARASLAADRSVRDPGPRRRGDRRPDQRRHGVQPPVRRVEGRAGPHRHRRGPRARPPRHPVERGQPRAGRHRLDERRDPDAPRRPPADRPPRHAGRRRGTRRVPALGRRGVDDRPAHPHGRRLLVLAATSSAAGPVDLREQRALVRWRVRGRRAARRPPSAPARTGRRARETQRVPARVAAGPVAPGRPDRRAQVRGEHRSDRVVRHVAGLLDQLPAHRPPRPLRVRRDPEVVGGDRGPDLVRACGPGRRGAGSRTGPRRRRAPPRRSGSGARSSRTAAARLGDPAAPARRARRRRARRPPRAPR